MDYKVFISHGNLDTWIAGQMAKEIKITGASTFLDETDIPKGANFKQIVHREIHASQELVVLFTPQSAKRSWVWIEMGAAWAQEKPIIAVFYGMTVIDLEENGQGRAILEDINIMNINDFSSYLLELTGRVQETSQ